jgi:ribosomal protein L40E
MSVKQAILDFVDGEIRNKIFVTPGIPAKKLNAARSQFISRDEEVIVLYDDTVFGSGKDGIAITENYIYAKQLWEVPKSIKISSIRSIESQSKSLNNLEIYLNGNLFITVSTPEKSDHAFLVGILKAAKDAAAKPEKKKGKAAPTAEAPSPVPARSAPKAKLRSAAPEDVLSCEECRAALPTGAKFCLECGTKVMPKGICLECNAKLPEKARFCSECGTPAGRAPAKSVQPKIDTEALRAELTKWLSAAGQYASIDGDGDLTLQLTAPAPSFAKNFRAWLAQCDLRISSEGVTEENNNDSSFFARGDEFSIRSPYCRVGKLASASYQMAIKLQVFSLQELEFHEIELKDGALSIPELASSQVKIKSLTTRRDDDGSFGVEYELEAYPNHVVQFDVLTEKPGSDAAVWGRVEAEATQSGTSWLWDVKPGQKIYVCFGEYKPLLDGIEAMFSGTARPAGGAYDDADEVNSSTNLSVGSVYRLEPRDKNNFKEVLELSNESGKTAYRNRTYKFGAINLTVTNTEELSYLESYLKDEYFCSSEFCQVELDHCSHLIEEDWDFENDGDRLRFEPSDNSQDLLEHLETNHGFEARSIYYEFIEGGFSTTPIDDDSQGPRTPGVSTSPSEPNDGSDQSLSAGSDIQNDRAKLAALASSLEEKFISNGRIAAFFEDCENLYIRIYLDLDPLGKTLLYEVTIETDGTCEDEGDTQEEILDYISDNGLSDGLGEIFGERDVTDDTEWFVHIRPLES